MKKTNSYKIKQLAHQRSVWIILLSIWLFCASVSLVHAQEHAISNDFQCQLCFTSFNYTPFVVCENLSFTPIIQESFVFALPHSKTITVDIITSGNRDPPQK